MVLTRAGHSKVLTDCLTFGEPSYFVLYTRIVSDYADLKSEPAAVVLFGRTAYTLTRCLKDLMVREEFD